MIEANLRIVAPAEDLWVAVRKARVTGTALTNDLLQKACGALRYRHGLAACKLSGDSSLLVATDQTIPSITLRDEHWEICVEDTGETSRLSLNSRAGEESLPILIEQALLVQMARRTDKWTLESPRNWYDPKPFDVEDGVAAFGRTSVSAIVIDRVGIGLSAKAQTAFFTTEPVSWFHDAGLHERERKARLRLFERHTDRQQGQKGTLLYDNGKSRLKCYFSGAPEGLTCATTGTLRVRGKSYASLAAYYQEEYPELRITPETPVAYVSFQGLPKPQPVAATLLKVRVHNENVPGPLRNADKLEPQQRRNLALEFWEALEPKPLGRIAPGLLPGFWCPDPSRVRVCPQPVLQFGKGKTLTAPNGTTQRELQQYFRRRGELLANGGCYSLPPAVNRTLICSYPKSLARAATEKFMTDLSAAVSDWTGVPFGATYIPYETVDGALEDIRSQAQDGVVVFVLNDEPAAYYEVALNLTNRLKRVQDQTLGSHYDYLTNGVRNRKTGAFDKGKGRQRWDAFINLNALDVLQQMDAVPWRISAAGPYEAQLVIDVGHDRKYYALSLLIVRESDTKPCFRIETVVRPKADHQHEEINLTILRDEIAKLFRSALGRHGLPLRSVLVLRDGRVCGREMQAIDEAKAQLISGSLLAADVRLDVVEFHKDSMKHVQLWDVCPDGSVSNVPERLAVEVNKDMEALSNTGRATLTQGTADPVALVATEKCTCLSDATDACAAAAQLNWSSPSVAQRLSLPFKRTDDELTARAQQEVRRTR